MTISSEVRKAGPFIGNDSSTVFPFTFKVFSAADLLVVRLNTSTGIETTLVITTNFTVSLNADQDVSPGGNVTLLSALATGANLIITSDISNLQSTDLTNGGGFYPTVINDALDRATIQIQQVAQDVASTLRGPLTDSVSLDMTLPSAAARANSVLVFDASGEPTIVPIGTSGVESAALIRDVLSGNGSQVTFTLSRSPDVGGNALQIFIDGVYQARVTFSLLGDQLTFGEAPPLGTANIEVLMYEVVPIDGTDAALVTYAPAGAGAVNSNVQAKLRESVSVFDFMPAAQIAFIKAGDTASQDGAVVTAAIQAALDTGSSVFFPEGVYGLAGSLSVAFAGQTIYGAGKNQSGSSGTRIKRLSGTANPMVTVVGDNGTFENFSFDNNNAANAVCVKFTAHGLTVRDLDFYNQAGGEVSLWLDSVNTSNYYNIYALNMRITETLYTNFYGLGLVGGLAGNVLYINGLASAGANGCQNLNFFGVFLENSNDTSSVRIDDNVTNVHFYGVRGEIGAAMATALFDINGDKTGSNVYLARNITVDGFTFAITTGSFGNAVPYFKVSNAQNITIKNAYFKDTLSSAGLDYIVLDDVKYVSIEDCFAYAGNTFNFITCTSNCLNVSAKNCNQFESVVGTMIWRGTIIIVENTNMAQTFSTSADQITFTNVSGTIDLSNSTAQVLINSSTPTNISSNGSTTMIRDGVVRSGVASVASASNLVLTTSGENFLVTGTTSITSIASGSTIIGRRVVLTFADVLTVTDGNNLKLAGNFTTSADDTLTLFCDGTDWYEQARSVN